MLCLKAETLEKESESEEEEEEEDLYPPSETETHEENEEEEAAIIIPFVNVNIGNTIQRFVWKALRRSSSSSSFVYALDTVKKDHDDDHNDNYGETEKTENGNLWVYKSQLQQDITILQKQLQEENDLHLALASALEKPTAPFPNSSCKLPDEVQELLANITVLEITVAKLEEELVVLQFQLGQERNERRLTEYRLRQLPSSSQSPLTCSHASPKELISRPFCKYKQETKVDGLLLQTDETAELNKDCFIENLRHRPNQLSEEMVKCMRNIFLRLSDSSDCFGCMASLASPQGHLSHSSAVFLSDSHTTPALIDNPSVELELESEILASEQTFDPYQVPGKVNWTKYIGDYSIAVEVSWMSVGEKQLEYAAGALKRFRLLVEQLAEVNPASMSSDERLAFWINLYNALIMHAYLAYGVPRSDMKLFSLMQKAAYTIGGHSFSAADIEYIILKMKPPSHRPQIALVLALHKFKISEQQRNYSIDNPEPLVAFALSSGMHSSPAVRIFRPANVNEDLRKSLKDYIRASVGIDSKGKLLVPKLLHCYAKGIVEESLLPDWICQFLSPEQAAMVRNCSSHRRQRLLSARSFTIIPFDSRFRYLFLMENESTQAL